MNFNIFLKHRTFNWTGTTIHGEKESGEIIALSKNHAKIKLQYQQINSCQLTLKSTRSIDFFKKIPSRELALFFRQLSTLNSAGLSLIRCCDILKNSSVNSKLQQLIQLIKKDIESGKELSTSLALHPTYFNHFTQQLIHLGERTGNLSAILLRIANYLDHTIELKNKIFKALFYPLLITLVAGVITIIMLFIVIPQFAELFASMNSKLPPLTLFIINLANIIREMRWILVLIMMALIFSLPILKKSPRFIKKFEYYLLQLFLFGPILQKITVSRLARNLALTYKSGLPLTDGLKLTANTSNNLLYKDALHEVQSDIIKGIALHKALKKNSLFTPLLIQMVQTGEESGQLDLMLEKVAVIYEEDIDYFITLITTLLEPIILIVLSLFIAGLIIAMYLPIFKLGSFF